MNRAAFVFLVEGRDAFLAGPEALAMVAHDPPDIVISDIGMPGMDGYDLIRRLRQDEETRSLPTVALTAFARSEDRARAQEAGFDEHLAKPLEPALLAATVAALVRRGPGREDAPALACEAAPTQVRAAAS